MAGNSTVAALTAASALDGTELLYSVQGGNDRKATSLQVKTYAVGAGSMSVASGKTGTFSASITITGTDGKALTVTNSGTVAGGDAWVLAIAAGKTLTVSNSITFAGTDATVMTFPTTSATVARTDAANAFTGVQTVAAATATPAGGSTAARLLFGTTAGFGIYYGSGAPSSLTAAQGSLYLRSDGTGVADRAYINTTGSTTWTAIATAG